MIHPAPCPGDLPEGFLEIPALVYAGDPMWVPEDPEAVEKDFSAGNPWFGQGEAQAWCLPGKARVAAFHDPRACVNNRPVVFFGYWETTGDREANARLFDEVEAWAERRGATDLYGPINFTTYGHYRLRVFAEPGAMTFQDEPYNPLTYPALLESIGFEQHHGYVTQILPEEKARPLHRLFCPAYEKLISLGYHISTLNASIWLDELPELHRLVDATFADNFAYTALSYEAFVEACGPLFIRRACQETSVIVYGPEGDIAGFLLCFPHYGPLIVSGAGAERVNATELDYARHAPLLRRTGRPDVLVKTVGVSPQHRRSGLMVAMIYAMGVRGLDIWNQWFGAIIREDNPSRRPGMNDLVFERRYGLYRKQLAV